MEYAIEPGLYPKIKSDYILGKGSVREVCESYGVNQESEIKAVKQRSYLEKWPEERKSYLDSICSELLEEKKIEAIEWEKEVSKTSKREWNYISHSVETLVQSGQGIDSDTIAGYARARKTYDDMARRALGLIDPDKRLDITSNGQSIGESLVSALERLRDAPESKGRPVVELTEAEIEYLRTAEIERTDGV